MAWQIVTRKSQPHRKLFPVLRVKKKKKEKKKEAYITMYRGTKSTEN